MPYIFESYKSDLKQQFEVFAFDDGSLDLDAFVGSEKTTVALDKEEVEQLHKVLGYLLDGLTE